MFHIVLYSRVHISKVFLVKKACGFATKFPGKKEEFWLYPLHSGLEIEKVCNYVVF